MGPLAVTVKANRVYHISNFQEINLKLGVCCNAESSVNNWPETSGWIYEIFLKHLSEMVCDMLFPSSSISTEITRTFLAGSCNLWDRANDFSRTANACTLSIQCTRENTERRVAILFFFLLFFFLFLGFLFLQRSDPSPTKNSMYQLMEREAIPFNMNMISWSHVLHPNLNICVPIHISIA